LGVGSELLIFLFTRLCGHVTATDLYSGDTAWREARYQDFRASLLSQSPFPIPAERLTLESADMRSLPVPDGSQDFVWSTSSIEHVPGLPDVLDVLREAGRVLRPGGYALLTTEFCISEPPYLLPHVNALDAGILSHIFGGMQGFEAVGPTHLDVDWTWPANGPMPRRNLVPGFAPWRTGPLDHLKGGQVINPVGISLITPVGFVLRRTNAPIHLLTVTELGIAEPALRYIGGMADMHAGRLDAAAQTLLGIADDNSATLQTRLHAFRFGIDARLRSGMPTREAADHIIRFLGRVPVRACDDADFGDLCAYVLGEAGARADAIRVAEAGALSPSTVHDQALRLAIRAARCRLELGHSEEALSLSVQVAIDLITQGWSVANVRRIIADGSEPERLHDDTRDRLLAMVDAEARRRYDLRGHHLRS
jgi:SAM-dependent methyltransferase